MRAIRTLMVSLLGIMSMSGCDGSTASGSDMRAASVVDASTVDGHVVADDMRSSTDGSGCQDPLDPACTACLPMLSDGMARVQACQEDPKCVAAQMDLVCCLGSAAQNVSKRQHCLQLFSPVSVATFNLFYTYNEECGIACKMH